MNNQLDPADLAVYDRRLNHICQGNDQAREFLSAYGAFSHMLDDAVDGDLAGDTERAALTSFNFIAQCMVNPFVQKNAGVLLPVMLMGVNAWIDSDIEAKSEDQRIRRASDVLKSHHAEICFQVAYCIGGIDHMRECSKMWRTFDFDQQEEETNRE